MPDTEGKRLGSINRLLLQLPLLFQHDWLKGNYLVLAIPVEPLVKTVHSAEDKVQNARSTYLQNDFCKDEKVKVKGRKKWTQFLYWWRLGKNHVEVEL